MSAQVAESRLVGLRALWPHHTQQTDTVCVFKANNALLPIRRVSNKTNNLILHQNEDSFFIY